MVDHPVMRIFGCTTYIHVNKGKLDPKSKKGIFLGHLEGVKGYKFCITESNMEEEL